MAAEKAALERAKAAEVWNGAFEKTGPAEGDPEIYHDSKQYPLRLPSNAEEKLAELIEIENPDAPKEQQKKRKRAAKEYIDFKEFDKIWPRLTVVGRAFPIDKRLLVAGLMASQKEDVPRPQFTRPDGGVLDARTTVGERVAVTGDGTNDAPALAKADVGFAMGIQGTDAAKAAAAIIILDDNFASIVNAAKWGRNVYDSVQKFLQFQLTVNLVAITLAVSGAAIIEESPLGAVQLLWVNMIMDSFASLALATEVPKDTILDREPFAKNASIITKIMWRNLFGQSVYQIAVLMVMLFWGAGTPDEIGGFFEIHSTMRSFHTVPYSGDSSCAKIASVCNNYYDTDEWKLRNATLDHLVVCDPTVQLAVGVHNKRCLCDTSLPNGARTEWADEDHGGPFDEQHCYAHFNMLFTAFVMMQLFNQVNARMIWGEWNMMAGVLSNGMFLLIMLIEAAGQVVITEFGGVVFAAVGGLKWWQWLVCVGAGFGSWPVHVIVACVPSSCIPMCFLTVLEGKPEPEEDEEADAQVPAETKSSKLNPHRKRSSSSNLARSISKRNMPSDMLA